MPPMTANPSAIPLSFSPSSSVSVEPVGSTVLNMPPLSMKPWITPPESVKKPAISSELLIAAVTVLTASGSWMSAEKVFVAMSKV